jgi:hypothetical protein
MPIQSGIRSHHYAFVFPRIRPIILQNNVYLAGPYPQVYTETVRVHRELEE